jgi:hypothetical protein
MFTRPVTAVPSQRDSQTVVKMKVYAILGAAALSAFLGVLSFVAWVVFTPDVPTAEALLPQGRAMSELVARDFLAGRTTAVPVAADVDPSFGGRTYSMRDDERREVPVTSISPLSFSRETLVTPDATQDYEIHSYLVSSRGRLLRLDVTLLITPEGPVLAAQPSLQAVPTPSESYAPLDYRQFSSTGDPTVNDKVTAKVAAWAAAFSSNDAQALRDVTGDQASPGEYIGLGGFKVADTPRVLRTLPVGESALLLRVQLLLSDVGDDGAVVSADYDVLVHDAFSELPKVVAWGPAGAPTLEPQMNNPSAGAITTNP